MIAVTNKTALSPLTGAAEIYWHPKQAALGFIVI